MKNEINSLFYNELEDIINNLGEKKFRAKQIFNWIHNKLVSSYDEMINIPKELRQKLKNNLDFNNISIIEKFESNEDDTIKYLFKLFDNNVIETVLMHYKHGYTVCISSQVGCRMGCKFCASTINGLERNLMPSEMLNQIYEIEKDQNIKISNIVIMGSGEPLENYKNIIKFLKIIHSEQGQNISYRNITLSTCGLVDKIYELANENLPITLAISLHAPTDEIRNKIMPISKKYKMNDLLKSCRDYIKITGRRITFEYALIKDVNDSKECAKQLASKLDNMLCHVNLIPVNEVKEKNYKKSSKDAINKFYTILKNNGINVTIRRKLGSDINAACGQLRKSYIEKL